MALRASHVSVIFDFAVTLHMRRLAGKKHICWFSRHHTSWSRPPGQRLNFPWPNWSVTEFPWSHAGQPDPVVPGRNNMVQSMFVYRCFVQLWKVLLRQNRKMPNMTSSCCSIELIGAELEPLHHSDPRGRSWCHGAGWQWSAWRAVWTVLAEGSWSLPCIKGCPEVAVTFDCLSSCQL